jgi:hypothetical protein
MGDVMEDDKFGPPPKEGVYFRAAIGIIAMLTAIGGFAALFVIRVPPENRDAMMFALGAVFGWAGSVVASEYGATTTGRRVADAAVKKIEQETATASADATAARENGGRP